MIVLVLLLWLMSSILLLRNPQDEKIRWASFTGFFGGFGGLGTLLGEGLDRPEWILFLDGLFTSIGHYLTPYGMLIFGLVYSDTIKTRKQKKLYKLLFLIPVVMMYLLFQVYPEFKVDFVSLSIWVVPYVLSANISLIYSAWRENRPTIKKRKILTCLFVVPVFSFVLITNIILEAVGIEGVWNYNPWMIGVQFLVFIYFAIKYGILGVQIRFEKERRDSTMKAVTSGTALLNHTIKNEIAKIDLLVSQLKEDVSIDKSSSERIDLALSSTHHVLELSTRIQSKLDIMNFKESEFWVGHSVDTALSLLQPYLSEIKIIKQYEVDVKIYGDPVHIQETLLNIIKNAIDAMENTGVILIKVYKTRRNVYIDFTDNGKGIEKDKISLVLDPFYSTKARLGNYGLGLTYCYNVIEKHDGDILIKSQINQGTTITLSLPTKRVIDTKINQQSNSKASGANSLWIKLD